MTHSEARLALRPDLSHLKTSGSSEHEIFQNSVLRPIIKMQHFHLLKLGDGDENVDGLKRKAKNEEHYKVLVIEFLKKNAPLKNQIIGMIIGHFTEEEWQSYALAKSEYNKRILQISGERIGSASYIG
jgi:hypothetical protein